MKKHNLKNPFLSFFPFVNYGGLFRASLMSQELVTSSLQVITQRMEMMNQAMNGKLPLTHMEFIKMWQEKIEAGSESSAKMMQFLQHELFRGKPIPAHITPALWNRSIRHWIALMQPYHSRSTANAKRLGRKSNQYK